jgi:hypothetical protein
VKKTNHGIIVIVIYVDDLIITRDNDGDIFDLKKLLKQKFEMKDLGELGYFLVTKVIQSPKRIWLLQRQYALNKLSKYGMTGCKPISIPLEQNVKLSVDERNLVEDTTMYKCIVGNLIYMTIVATPLWPKLEVGSLPGLPNVQSSTARGKTPRIGVFLVSFERS